MNSSQTNNAPMLEVKQLGCVRNERVLFENLSLTLNEAECLHLKGNNGSGKTSLLRIIAGINQSNAGHILWNGNTLATAAVRHDFLSNLAYLGHKDGLKNELTVVENLTFYRQFENSFDALTIDRDLARMKILEHADIATAKLSFGQRRRLAFARLLSSNFSLWILDEPFTGIDKEGRQLIEQICLEHLQSSGSIILTNHQDLSESLLVPHLIEIQL